MFSKKATLTIDTEMCEDTADDCLKRALDTSELSPSRVERLAAERLQQLDEAKANIKLAQEKQKVVYDRKHANPKVHQVSSKVLKKDVTRKKWGKMDAKYVGTSVITKSLGKDLYALRSVENPHNVIDWVNGIHLKPYLSPPPSPSYEDCEHSLNSTPSPDHDHSLNSTLSPDCERSLNPDFSPDYHDDTVPPLPPPLDVLIQMNAVIPVCALADSIGCHPSMSQESLQVPLFQRGASFQNSFQGY